MVAVFSACMQAAAESGVKWEHDMRHNTADPAEIISQVCSRNHGYMLLMYNTSDHLYHFAKKGSGQT